MIRANDIGVIETELLLREEPRVSPRESRRFTREEAKAEIGTRVCLRADYHTFREGAEGHVVDYHESDRGDFEVVILLNVPDGPGQVHERFSREDYVRFLQRLPKV